MGVLAQRQAVGVIRLLKDPRPAVRAKAAFACGALGDQVAASEVAVLLGDTASQVRDAAVRAIARLDREGEHVGKVAERLLDTAPSVRVAACAALADMGESAQYFASLVAQRLSADREPLEVRAAAARALGGMGERGAVHKDTLQKLLEDPSPLVRQAAEDSLRRLGGPGVAALAAIEQGEGE
uniref:HEAT repeat domain-containing protein n=1 Tax=Zooxanthella nutricula TaxID=1333877 RepID=A0A7S2PCA5_9DINO